MCSSTPFSITSAPNASPSILEGAGIPAAVSKPAKSTSWVLPTAAASASVVPKLVSASEGDDEEVLDPGAGISAHASTVAVVDDELMAVQRHNVADTGTSSQLVSL